MFGRTVGAAAVMFGLLLGTSTEARAQAPFGSSDAATAENTEHDSKAADEPAAPPVERRWYGQQTILADAASLSMLGIAALADSGPTSGVFAGAGALSWTLGAPIVHFAHGHVGKGFADLGIRVGGVAVGATIGATIALFAYQPPPPRNDGTLGGAIVDAIVPAVEMRIAMYEGAAIGAGVGALTAMIIDHGAIAHEDVKKPGIQILPTAQATPGGFRAGVTGVF